MSVSPTGEHYALPLYLDMGGQIEIFPCLGLPDFSTFVPVGESDEYFTRVLLPIVLPIYI